MKKLAQYFAFCFLFISYAHAQSWTVVGAPTFSDSNATHPVIAIDSSGTPYVVYQDFPAITVMKFNGSNWVAVGNTYFSNGMGANSPTIAIDGNGVPYVAFIDDYALAATVMKYQDTGWKIVGTPFAPGTASGGSSHSPSIAFDRNDIPYVSFTYCFGPDVDCWPFVYKYNDSIWRNLGAAPSDSTWTTSLAVDNSGTPYVAYQINQHQVGVSKYNDSSHAMVNVGNTFTSDGGWGDPSIAIDRNNIPYIVSLSIVGVIVMKYNDSSWVSVGAPGSIGGGAWPSIAIGHNNMPYVVFVVPINGYTGVAIVEKYNGSSWDTVGSFATYASFTKIAIDTSGTPYVSYIDNTPGHTGVTVMRYGFPESVKNITKLALSLTTSPNPTHNSFTLHITSPTKDNATIIITNMLGEKVKQLTATTNTDTQIQLNVPPGIYFISAVTKEGSVNEKIEIQ